MKIDKIFTVIGLLAIFLFFSGCFGPTTVSLRPQYPSVTYPDKFPANVALYFDEEITTYINRVSTTGDFCVGHSYDIPIGTGITNAILHALEGVFVDVAIVKNIPQAEDMSVYDAIVLVELNSIDDDFEITELTYGQKIKATFNLTLNLEMFGKDMKTVYSFAPHASGMKSDRVNSCSEIGDIIGLSVEKALSLIANDVAQVFYSARQVDEYIKSIPE